MPGRSLSQLLGAKAQGVDHYRYYSDLLQSGNQGQWAGEFDRTREHLAAFGVDVSDKSLLDLSGEPGFFAGELAKRGGAERVVVTAFADSVAAAMREQLGLEAYEYDYQRHRLAEIIPDPSFDGVFVRYSIVFCVDLPRFFEDLLQITSPQAFLCILYSPATRAVCARWMSDDYTYLVSTRRSDCFGAPRRPAFA